VLNKKHLRWVAARDAGLIAARLLLRGQTNFIKSVWKFNSVYDAALLLKDHQQPVRYEIPLPPASPQTVRANTLYIHEPRRRSAPAGAGGAAS
jgi:hopanoid C-3 methylase